MTTETETTVQTLAREAADWFEGAVRPTGESIRKLKEGRPEWVYDLVKDAHGDFMPDDWRYDKIENALLWIADADDPEDSRGEFGEEQVDTYNNARVAWLGSNLQRAAYCDEEAEQAGATGGVYNMIGMGQYAEAEEIYGLVLQFLTEKAAEAGTIGG